MRLKRTLITMLTLLLVFIPFSVFAQTSNNDITYVSIGDSLAAGMLSDRTIGAGYVGVISNQLTDYGYDVTVKNLGVSGAKSGDVLDLVNNTNDFPDHADIVTITTGANDLVLELDIPNVARLIELEQQFGETYKELTKIMNNLGKNFGEIEALIDQITTTLAEEEKLPEEIEEEIMKLTDHYMVFKGSMNDVFSGDNFEYDPEDFQDDPEKLKKALDAIVDTIEEKQEKIEISIKSIVDSISTLPINLEDHSLLDDEIAVLDSLIEHFEAVSIDMETFSNNIKSFSTIISEIIDLKDVKETIDELPNIIETVGINMSQIINEVKQKYPDAKIYVMGYYNALPYLPENVQATLIPLIEGLNNAIKGAVDGTGATYVSTYEMFEGNYEAYLPNSEDIHPSEAGYRALAEAFLAKIFQSFPIMVQQINLNELAVVNPGQLIIINGTNVQLQLPDTMDHGTNLIITETDGAIVSTATGLKRVGSVLHFDFSPDPTGQTFTLTFSYDHDSDDVAIYHFNEDTEQWEKVGGVVNSEMKQITVEVDHFSNYGVFADASSEVPIVDEDDQEVQEDPEREEDETSVIVQNRDDEEGTSETTTGTLPNTATNMYNFIAFGTLFIAIGFTMYVFTQRRKFVEK